MEEIIMREKILQMKVLFGIIAFLLIMIILAMIVLHGSEASQKRNENITIQTIDNHEYIVTGYKGGICHKVNCIYCEGKKNGLE
jgi:hypothetical protein